MLRTCGRYVACIFDGARAENRNDERMEGKGSWIRNGPDMSIAGSGIVASGSLLGSPDRGVVKYYRYTALSHMQLS